MKNTIGILNFGSGNLMSILQVFQKLSISLNIIIIKSVYDFNKIDRLILPGQGSIDSCIDYLYKFNLIQALITFCHIKPIMGICVGKHILFNKNEEGYNYLGLNLFSGEVKKFNNINNELYYKVPHIGWNKVKLLNNHYLLTNIPNLSPFYFVHSYYVLSNNLKYIYGITNYMKNFVSILIKNNIILTQFHPEKSSIMGLKLCYNFCLWKP